MRARSPCRPAKPRMYPVPCVCPFAFLNPPRRFPSAVAASDGRAPAVSRDGARRCALSYADRFP